MADEPADVTDAPTDDAAADGEHGDAVPAGPEVKLLHGVPVTTAVGGQRVLHPDRDQLLDVVRALADDGYTMCLDVCGVDYLTFAADRGLPPGTDGERFEVVVTLISHDRHDRIRLRVQVPGSDPSCPSLFGVHPGAEAMEREVYDLVGIAFDDHPDLSRILMPEEWVGHPLRKDHPIGAIPVQFKAAPGAR